MGSERADPPVAVVASHEAVGKHPSTQPQSTVWKLPRESIAWRYHQKPKMGGDPLTSPAGTRRCDPFSLRGTRHSSGEGPPQKIVRF